MDTEEISVGEFVSRLFELRFHKTVEKPATTELLRYGHYRGWLEDIDERQPAAPLNRQSAARIIHQFIKLECGIPDLVDIAPALRLHDLYTCRACSEHIAQVYTRGLMPAEEPGDLEISAPKKEEPDFSDSSANPILIFNHLAPVTRTEAQLILEKLFQLIS